MSETTKEWVGTEPVTFRDARECAFAVHGALMVPGGIGEAERYIKEWTKAQNAALREAIAEVAGWVAADRVVAASRYERLAALARGESPSRDADEGEP